MIIRLKGLFFQSIFILLCSNIFATGPFINDTTFVNTKLNSDTVKVKPILFLNFSTGILINKTFGIHPLFNVYFKYRYKRNYLKLVYEHRFGNSKNNYSILDNDTLKKTNAYKSDFFGLEYERTLFQNPNHDLYSDIGLGYDWLEILKKDQITHYKLIGGLGANFGLGYAYYIHKKHGPNVELLYHIGKLDNRGGSDLNSNSLIIRLNYYFHNVN